MLEACVESSSNIQSKPGSTTGVNVGVRAEQVSSK